MRVYWISVVAVCALVTVQDAAAQFWLRPEKPARSQRQETRTPPTGIPLPKPRPFEAGARPTITAVPQTKTEPAPEPTGPSACFLELTAGLAEAQPLPPIAQGAGCEEPDVVRLDAILLKDRRRIPVSPPAVLRCPMATAVANWMREDVQSLVAASGGTISGLDNYASFECRGRNRVVGARISEHGRGNALDMRAVLLSGGKKIELTNPEVARPLREALRVSACNRFTTVLGPGSDGYHEDHVHIDLAERRNGYRICQWDVRDPFTPLPRERPPEADAAAVQTPAGRQ